MVTIFHKICDGCMSQWIQYWRTINRDKNSKKNSMKFFLWFSRKPISHLDSSVSLFSFLVSWSYTRLIQESSSSLSPFLLVRGILEPLQHGDCHPQPHSVFTEVWFILTHFWCFSLHIGCFCSWYLRSYNGVFSLYDPGSIWSQPQTCFLSTFLYPS